MQSVSIPLILIGNRELSSLISSKYPTRFGNITFGVKTSRTSYNNS